MKRDDVRFTFCAITYKTNYEQILRKKRFILAQ